MDDENAQSGSELRPPSVDPSPQSALQSDGVSSVQEKGLLTRQPKYAGNRSTIRVTLNGQNVEIDRDPVSVVYPCFSIPVFVKDPVQAPPSTLEVIPQKDNGSQVNAKQDPEVTDTQKVCTHSTLSRPVRTHRPIKRYVPM